MSIQLDGSAGAGLSTTPPDLRRATRLLAAVLIPVGPAAVAVLRYVLPYETNDSTAGAVAAIRAHPGTQSAVVWLGLVAILTLVPGVIWIGRLTRRRAPRLTAVALVLLVPGYLSLSLLVGTDAALYFAAEHGLSPRVMGQMYDGLHPVLAVGAALFVLGHVLGTILLGLALWHSRTVPAWAAVVVIAAQPIHFVAAVIVGSHTLDLVGWGLNAVGFAVAAAAVLRTRDDDWDLGPVPRS